MKVSSIDRHNSHISTFVQTLENFSSNNNDKNMNSNVLSTLPRSALRKKVTFDGVLMLSSTMSPMRT